MTRLIGKVLSEQLISCPEIAHIMAAKVSAGIIREMGGQRFYVPLRDQRAGLKDHGHIEAALLQHITPTQLAQGMTLPTMAVREIATTTAASHRTVYRVLDRLRRQAGGLPARP
jgi:Mor family transcriptional regulator